MEPQTRNTCNKLSQVSLIAQHCIQGRNSVENVCQIKLLELLDTPPEKSICLACEFPGIPVYCCILILYLDRFSCIRKGYASGPASWMFTSPSKNILRTLASDKCCSVLFPHNSGHGDVQTAAFSSKHNHLVSVYARILLQLKTFAT